jgi:hypothetical protein
MGKSWALLVGFMLCLGTPIVADAATVEWSGTLTVSLGGEIPSVHYGTGVATLNGSGGLGHLNTIGLAGGLSYSGGNNVPETFPVTDPAVATVTSVRVTGARLGTFTLNGISGAPPLGSKNTGLLPGRMKICLLDTNCTSYITMPFGTPSGNVGIGVGGVMTINGFGPGVQISVTGAPWTIGVTSIVVTTGTDNGGITTHTETIQGFVHGPVSATSSTAALSGVIQMVTPVVIQSSACSPETLPRKAGWASVRLRFIPEPDILLILGANLVALVVIGRRRMKP